MTADPSAGSRRSGVGWWRMPRLGLPVIRRFQRGAAPYDVRSARLRELSDVSAVLDRARALIQSGWVQDGWYAVRHARQDAAGVVTLEPKPPGDMLVTGACVVGAVLQVIRRNDPAAGLPEAAPALDVLWDACQEACGRGGPGVAGRAAPPQVRLARIRDLTRWNDRPGRTREDVIRLLDLATARAIMEAANIERTNPPHLGTKTPAPDVVEPADPASGFGRPDAPDAQRVHGPADTRQDRLRVGEAKGPAPRYPTKSVP